MCVTECLFLCLGFVFGTEVLRVSELAIRFSGVQWFGLPVDRGRDRVMALKRRCAISCNKLLEALAPPKPLGWPGSLFEIQIF